MLSKIIIEVGVMKKNILSKSLINYLLVLLITFMANINTIYASQNTKVGASCLPKNTECWDPNGGLVGFRLSNCNQCCQEAHRDCGAYTCTDYCG